MAGPNRGQQETVRILGEVDYVNGSNFAIVFRYAANHMDRLPALARELVALKSDLWVTPGTPGAMALKNATRTLPIVFLDVTDPVAAGLADSLARPGGNLTGCSSIEAVLAGKRLELLKEALPRTVRVGVLWNPRDPSAAQQWQESRKAPPNVGLQLTSLEVISADKLQSAFQEAMRLRTDALFVVATALASSNQTRITDLAVKYRLPAIYAQASFADSGGLIAYGPDQAERYRRQAALIEKILKGAKPSDIPVEQPTRFEFNVNLKAAKQIGLSLPPNLLARADKVIR